jgi:uncharacterized protein YjeT (DUF2065 family)
MKSLPHRKVGAALVVVHGLVTALAPQVSVKMIQLGIGMNFERAGELEAKPAYLRELRALGIGMIAAGGTYLLLDSVQQSTDGTSDDVSSDEAAQTDGETQTDEHDTT